MFNKYINSSLRYQDTQKWYFRSGTDLTQLKDFILKSVTLERVFKNNSYVTLKYINSLAKSLFSQMANIFNFTTKMSWLKQQMFLCAFLLIFTESSTLDK